ncbi:MAG: ATP-binding protein [Desulfobacteraceae bacterium]|jgi:signal transduction histidine kinase
MQIDKAFLKSKVARRIFFLFIFCALLPLFIIAGIAYTSVDTQLSEQAIKRLRQNCKIKGREIYNNLFFLEMELKTVASRLKGGPWHRDDFKRDDFERSLKSRFRGLVAVTEDGRRITILKDIEEFPHLTPEERSHMNIGRTLVLTRHDPDRQPRIHALRLIDPGEPEKGMIVAEIEPTYLWGIENQDSLASDMPMFILGPGDDLLFSSMPGFGFNEEVLDFIAEFPVAGSFAYDYQGQEYMAGYWSLFLKYHFLTPGWTIIMSQARSIVSEPIAYFKKLFFLLILLTFLVVCLLSVALIRKSLVPIESLRAGTERIANGAFGTEVEIKSGDEFESLGEAFNEMSRKLKEGRALLVQSAKMGAVGQMAAGVVHEIGQPLTSISGLIDLLKILGPSEDAKKHLELMKSEMERLTGIISRFKTFSRVSEEKMSPISLSQVVDATHVLLDHQLQMKNIDCVVEKTDGLPFIMGDRNSLEQVLINLIINAMDALEEEKRSHPSIHIRTYSDEDHVFVSIEDNGPGIPEEIKERIFDPFFTTKSEGKGTGLGLAIIDSILHQHHARISLESEVGVRTKFIISFPASSPSA